MALTLSKRFKDKQKKPEAPKVKSAAKPRQPKYLPGTRFVLFIGDEGAILLYIQDNVVKSRQFVPDASEQNLDELRVSLNQDTKAPISMAVDSMDQSYIQQTLPPVSAMSVNKLIRRRLDRDFGANDIKGAIPLGREETGRKDWNFLMVSIERSRQITMWLDFLLTLPNRFQGIYLVSVETEIVIKNLERAMGVPKTGTGSKWKLFVSHNKVGGFRQVVLRNGRIIFTRMSQPIGESTPEVIAGNIEQEMQSTLEYMKRLAYEPQSGLDVYIIASSSIKSLIDKSKFPAKLFHIMTPYEVAQFLGIEGATQATDQFGDVILAASIAMSRKHILTLTTPESKKYDTLYMAHRFQRVAAALVIIGTLGYAGGVASDIYLRFMDSEDLALAKRQHQRNLEELREEIKRSQLDVERVGDLMDLYQLLLKQTVLPLPFIGKIESVLKPPIVIKSIDWGIEDKTAAGNTLFPAKSTVVFTLQFPGVKDAETFRAVSKRVLADLKEQFKNYEISFTRVPELYTESNSLSMSFDNPAAANLAANTPVPDVQLTFKEL